jgi:4-hydroxyphenylpyruvate dioxygenase
MNLPFQIVGIDHVGFIVGNAKQAAHYYQSLFGFQRVAYRGLETGDRETVSYVLRQNAICYVFHTPLTPESELNEHLRLHGDGVWDIALRVNDARAAWEHTTARGAESVREPETITDDHGPVTLAAIRTYGDTIHTFVERTSYRGLFMPGYVRTLSPVHATPVGLEAVDHIVGNQPEGEMETVVKWYQEVFNFHRFWTVDDKDISTEYSSLRSVVVSDFEERIKMPINEPARGRRKSQIEEYIDFYRGPGVQHIAMSTSDIIRTVRELTARGVEFLPIPPSYYDALPDRVGEIDEDISDLAELGILADRDDDGYLLQLFTKPLEDRPTLFLEVIQRKGSKSFGKGNFKALFESIEREQARRGNL